MTMREVIADYKKNDYPWRAQEILSKLFAAFGDSLPDIVEVKQEGRLAMLPCKVGDTVFMPCGDVVKSATVISIHQNLVGDKPARWVLTLWCENWFSTIGFIGSPNAAATLYRTFDDFDKTVFLTEAAAIAALEAQK